MQSRRIVLEKYLIHRGERSMAVRTLSSSQRLRVEMDCLVDVHIKTSVFGESVAASSHRPSSYRSCIQVIARFGNFEFCHGSVHDLMRSFRNHITLDVVDVDMPPYERDSTGLWIDLSPEALKLMNEKEIQVAAACTRPSTPSSTASLWPQISGPSAKNAAKEFKTKVSTRKRPAR